MDGQKSVGHTQEGVDDGQKSVEHTQGALNTRRRVLETHFAPAGKAWLAVQQQKPAGGLL